MIKITEAPRDAMQGIKKFIPTSQKVRLINDLLKVGFDIIDFGSFVSPSAIPQLRDTAEVISKIDLSRTNTRLMAIVGNDKGGEKAASFEEIEVIGFPFSFSETFLRLNINSSIEKAKQTAEFLQNTCIKKNKTFLAYISMAFGNPYNDAWSLDELMKWVKYLDSLGISIISLSDITGIADGKMIADVFRHINTSTRAEIGLHLHTQEYNWYEKIDAAYLNGCRRFDGVMTGKGGCPMTGYELLGNLNTRHLLNYFSEKNLPTGLNTKAFEKAYATAQEIFSQGSQIK